MAIAEPYDLDGPEVNTIHYRPIDPDRVLATAAKIVLANRKRKKEQDPKTE